MNVCKKCIKARLNRFYWDDNCICKGYILIHHINNFHWMCQLVWGPWLDPEVDTYQNYLKALMPKGISIIHCLTEQKLIIY